VRAFLSYQTKDKVVAGNVRAFVEKVGIQSFLAHEDRDLRRRAAFRGRLSSPRRALFAVIRGECLKAETGWRSEVNSNCRYRFLNNQTQEDVGVRGAQTDCRDRPKLKRRVCLYGRQHSKETFSWGAMNATDVAAATIKGRPAPEDPEAH
jgi:hypothetical protein